MRAHTDARVLGDREVAEHLGVVGGLGAGQGPLVRPDVVAVAGLLTAAAGVDDDEGVDEAVAVVVVGTEVHVRVGCVEGVLGQVTGAGRPGRPADAEVAVGVPRVGVRHPVGTDDVADDVDETAGGLVVVLLDASRGNHAGGEEQVAEVLLGLRHVLVAGVDQHDDDADLAAQRCAIRATTAHHEVRGPERVLVGRLDHAVVETERSWLLGQGQRVDEDALGPALDLGQLGVELLLELGAWRHEAWSRRFAGSRRLGGMCVHGL